MLVTVLGTVGAGLFLYHYTATPTSAPLPLQKEAPVVVESHVGHLLRPGSGRLTSKVLFYSQFSRPGSLQLWNVVEWRYPYNGELQYYRPSNVVVRGGALRLIANKGGLFGGSYYSGMVTTQGKFAFKYGTVVVRAKLVAGQGLWPGVWMLPEGGEALPEVDILEEKGSQPNTVWMSQHWRLPGGGPSDIYKLFTGRNFSNGFNTFTLKWTPTSLTWLIDGHVECVRTANVPHVPLYLIMNLAVGGQFPGAPGNSTVFPNELSIRSVVVTASG